MRFSFIHAQEEDEYLGLIEKLSELAFMSTISSMIVPDDMRKSPIKGARNVEVRQSLGRLAEPVGTEKEFNLA